jgi:hypothetical protein
MLDHQSRYGGLPFAPLLLHEEASSDLSGFQDLCFA